MLVRNAEIMIIDVRRDIIKKMPPQNFGLPKAKEAYLF
jgi:hypothetical protein